MTAYRNFTVEFPTRLAELDKVFKPIASSAELEVSYTLMKLAASFLLPYERVEGTSGARTADLKERQSIRKYLELDKRFHQASYCSNGDQWSYLDVDDFAHGPTNWVTNGYKLKSPVHKVLETIRHSVAHSNLFFGGDSKIEHIYLGSRREKDPDTNQYRVLWCTVNELNHLVDAWITNLKKLSVSPSVIWAELEEAA